MERDIQSMRMSFSFFIYFGAINILTFLLFGADKKAAKQHGMRIPESVLLFLAAVGGFCGALIGMHIFHHKTHKATFQIIIPAIVLYYFMFFIILCI